MIDLVTDYLKSCGMDINTDKSMTVAIRAAPQQKKTAVDGSTFFRCDGRVLPNLRRSDGWRYLGVMFTPEGRSPFKSLDVIGPYISILDRAPLKPQQRLFALRTVVIPRLYH